MTDSNTKSSEIGKSNSDIFVLFSGHNDRAIIALCRYFAVNDFKFVVVCSSESNLITKTDWSTNCFISRIDKNLDLKLFEVVANALQVKYGKSVRLIYCPTSEFMNFFVLRERKLLSKIGWIITLPSAEIYKSLTSKILSQKLVDQLIGLKSPEELSWDEIKVPCVIKPRLNVNDGTVYYPKLCQTESELNEALAAIEPENWFPQAWVEGQSYYLCAYIAKTGESTHFWQENLLQQSGGKSIVLARATANPGVEVSYLFKGLIEVGFNGPFMMEVIRNQLGIFHYIEINPRFWGPLQLALDVCPEIIHLFVNDAVVNQYHDNTKNTMLQKQDGWYAWEYGAQSMQCKKYPAAFDVEKLQSLDSLVNKWDVYNKKDTQLIHGIY